MCNSAYEFLARHWGVKLDEVFTIVNNKFKECTVRLSNDGLYLLAYGQERYAPALLIELLDGEWMEERN